MRFAALASVPRITALAAGCSLLIETAQYALQLASRRWWRAGPTSPSDRRRPSRATRPRSPRWSPATRDRSDRPGRNDGNCAAAATPTGTTGRPV